MSEQVKIVFFTGTGGTARVANAFLKSLQAIGKTVIVHELNKRVPLSSVVEDMLIIIFPVHACNAPEPVYEYIRDIPEVKRTPAVVISVSGGGEITPNTACRLHCIKRLQKKGYNVVYEKMIVMPSNWIVPTVDGLAVRLLEILPVKVEKIIDDLYHGVNCRTKPNFFNRLLSNIGELEKYGARSFGKRMRVNQNCNGCGWCEKSCPRTNISITNSRPNFHNRCSLCLKCIYGCPKKALAPGIGKSFVIKQGYHLDSIEERVAGIQVDSIEKLAKGYLWKGVKGYLLNNE